MSFPTRLAEITLDWLNQALDTGRQPVAQRTVRFDAAPASGRGGTSSVHVLTLAHEPQTGPAPTKVLAKFSSESPEVREKAREHRLYEREVAFYRNFGPDAGIPVPACYAAEYDAASNTCVLLLEYKEGARSRDIYEGAPDDIEAAVRCLAPFHAKWWRRDVSGALPDGDDTPQALDRRIEKAGLALKRIHDGGHREAFGIAGCEILELWLANARPLAGYARARPLTLCHGSFHRGQILFFDESSRSPWFIDWQNVAANPGAVDLARIVVTGLLPAQRQAHERRLLSLYHSILLEKGVRDYPIEDLLDDYRWGLASLIVFHSLILGDYPVEVISRHWKSKDSFWDVLFRWPGEAAEEWGARAWLEETVGRLPKAL